MDESHPKKLSKLTGPRLIQPSNDGNFSSAQLQLGQAALAVYSMMP